MTRPLLAVVVLAGVLLSTCQPKSSVPVQRQPEPPRTDHSSEQDQEPLFAVMHKTAWGSMSYVRVLVTGSSVTLRAQPRRGCPSRSFGPFEGSEAQQVLELVARLSPMKLKDSELCERPLRHAATWNVVSMKDGIRYHHRQLARTSNPRCAEFEQACEKLFRLANLMCGDRGCVPATLDHTYQGCGS